MYRYDITKFEVIVFLKTNAVHDQTIKYLKEAKGVPNSLGLYLNYLKKVDRLEHFFDSLCYWRITKEGYDFWSDIDKKWDSYLRKKV